MATSPTNKSKTKKLPARSEVKPDDTWDLSSLFKNDAEWEKAFTEWEKQIPQYEKFRGTLGDGAAALAKCFEVRQRVRPRRRAARHLRLSENGRGHGRQRLPADDRPLRARRHARRRGGQLHPAGNPRRCPTKKLKEYVDVEAAAAVSSCSSNGSSATSRTRSAPAKRSCWRCRARWPAPPTASSASSTTPT